MSKPRIFLLPGDGSVRLPLTLPHAEAAHADAPEACPSCKATTWGVTGSGRRPSSDDQAWESDAYCTACKGHVGIIRYETGTLFGVREDEAVLRGRCRVY